MHTADEREEKAADSIDGRGVTLDLDAIRVALTTGARRRLSRGEAVSLNSVGNRVGDQIRIHNELLHLAVSPTTIVKPRSDHGRRRRRRAVGELRDWIRPVRSRQPQMTPTYGRRGYVVPV